jgi:nitroimidazol reductase NimA-like FMN-containing flavoprotein (pyridoxamine 5'-phosphate oxidase superfamily)
MLGQLDPQEIEALLQREKVGRLGCHANGRTYVVPITYAYADGAIFAHSTQGLKLHMMRENPNVCFQVDRIDDLRNWRSVIVWGQYEELVGNEASYAMAQLLGKVLPLTATQEMSQTSKDLTHQHRAHTEPLPAVTFRIRVI